MFANALMMCFIFNGGERVCVQQTAMGEQYRARGYAILPAEPLKCAWPADLAERLKIEICDKPN